MVRKHKVYMMSLALLNESYFFFGSEVNSL